MTRTETVDTILPIIARRPKVGVCLLFGSAAENDAILKGSDIDIAVAGEKELGIDCLAELQLELNEALKREVDLLDLNRLNGLILTEVLKNGIRIINRKPEILAYHMKRMMFYNEDMYPNYKMMVETKVKRFAYGK